VETVSAPRLLGIATKDFVVFKEAREIYECRVEKKNKTTNVNVQITTYRDSIPKSILQLLAIEEWVHVEELGLLTETRRDKCIAAHAEVFPSADLTRP